MQGVEATAHVAAHELAAMRRALALAERGRGSTSPNPIVGCVVLDAAGRVVGEGFHLRAGGPHAEVVALAAAGPAARGGTLVVTLEPCRHVGRTGPCVAEIRRAGIRRVVYAVADPTAAGGGGAELAAAGLDVVGGVLAAEAAAANRAWLHRVATGRPFVTWKYAATLDGRVAAADGSSRRITSDEARRDVHLLRAQSDAIVIGTGTALADDPALTVRVDDAAPDLTQPLRVVVGRRDLPPGARLRDDTAPTVQLRKHDPAAVLARLADRGVLSVLLEGGPTLAAAFLRARLVDRIVAYVAPILLGSGPPLVADLGIATLAAGQRWRIDEVTRIGPDLRLTLAPVSADATAAAAPDATVTPAAAGVA